MASIPRTPPAAALTHMTEAAIYDTKPYDDQKASPERTKTTSRDDKRRERQVGRKPLDHER